MNNLSMKRLVGKMSLIYNSQQSNYIAPKPGFDFRRMATMIPPPILLFLAILSIQLGADTAKNLFLSLGALSVGVTLYGQKRQE